MRFHFTAFLKMITFLKMIILIWRPRENEKKGVSSSFIITDIGMDIKPVVKT